MTQLGGPDEGRKESLLSDLSELLSRQAYTGSEAEYSFHDAEIAALPARLPDSLIRRIAEQVGRVLLDEREAGPLRSSAAFVLGKTHVGEGLRAIVAAIVAPGQLSAELARQCAFAFDALVDTCGAESPGLDFDVIGGHFLRQGVPWDASTRRVVVDAL